MHPGLRVRRSAECPERVGSGRRPLRRRRILGEPGPAGAGSTNAGEGRRRRSVARLRRLARRYRPLAEAPLERRPLGVGRAGQRGDRAAGRGATALGDMAASASIGSGRPGAPGGAAAAGRRSGAGDPAQRSVVRARKAAPGRTRRRWRTRRGRWRRGRRSDRGRSGAGTVDRRLRLLRCALDGDRRKRRSRPREQACRGRHALGAPPRAAAEGARAALRRGRRGARGSRCAALATSASSSGGGLPARVVAPLRWTSAATAAFPAALCIRHRAGGSSVPGLTNSVASRTRPAPPEPRVPPCSLSRSEASSGPSPHGLRPRQEET